MQLLETKYQKRSFGITAAIFVLLFIWFFLYILKDDPNIPATFEGGEITINFGTSATGQGEVQPTEPIKTSPKPEVAQPEKAAAPNITTQTNVKATVVNSSPEKSTTTSTTVTPKPAAKPQPSKSTSDALASLINGPKSEGSAQGGEGDDDTPGDKGSPNGSAYGNAYFGSGGGSGRGKGWGLNGRKLSNTGKEVQKCNESGTVVVQITVNRSGNVIDARYTKGTTNTNPCLVDPAIATARKYKWEPDPDAPEKQVGFIVVNFKLGD